jgi:hypothetical protein
VVRRLGRDGVGVMRTEYRPKTTRAAYDLQRLFRIYSRRRVMREESGAEILRGKRVLDLGLGFRILPHGAKR